MSDDLAHTLDDLAAYLRRYVVVTNAQTCACSLWVAHTHAMDAAEATPYLAINSPEPSSGKTRLLETLELVVAKPWLTSRVTAAVLPRRIAKEEPTLLLDESDAAFAGDREYAETLRGVLNSGYRRGGSVSVCVGQGTNIQYATLSTFSAKAIAGLNKLPDTVASRSIPIRLKRRTSSEHVERFRRRDAEHVAEPIRQSIESLAAFHVERLKDARPVIPEGLSDRAADVWEPLLAFADLAAGGWPEQARHAALGLATGGEVEDQSHRIRVLADLRTVFENANVDRLASAALVERLNALEDSPWAEWSHGRGLTQAKLADLLRQFEVRPRSIRLAGGETPKGYLLEQFVEPWERYLPAPTPSQDATPPQPAPLSQKPAGPSRHTEGLVAASKTGSNTHGQTDVAAMAVQKPE